MNKNVSAGNKYDKHLDLVRMGMLMGQLSEPQKEFRVFFGHTEPKQCNMRIYSHKAVRGPSSRRNEPAGPPRIVAVIQKTE